MLAIRIHENGGVEKIRAEDVALPEPGPGDLRIKVEAAGLNFIDTYKRSGLYAVKLPHTLGQEAAGVVTALGAGVTGFRVGDRVASAAVNGGYAQEALVSAAQAVAVPAGVSAQLAAAVMLQGMTAHYLACDTFPLNPVTTPWCTPAPAGSDCCSFKSQENAGPVSSRRWYRRQGETRPGRGRRRRVRLYAGKLC